MAIPRPTPFALVFGASAPERFPAIRAGLAAAGLDPRDRDGFVLVREVAELLRELRPEEGVGVAVHALVALLHHAYLFWAGGEQLRTVSEEELESLLVGRSAGRYSGSESAELQSLPTYPPPLRPSRYVQLPSLRVWATPVPGQPVEPLDGWFVERVQDRLLLLAIFGLSPARDGLTAVELSGERPPSLTRPDGSLLFSPTLAGGAAARLASVAGEEELLELAWRAEALR